MKAFNTLIKFGIKPSMQRIAIMEYLLDNHIHPSIETIYTALYHKMPTLSKTTVYNTLKLFEEHKAVCTLTIDEKNVCYDIDTTPHGHFICKCCNEIKDIEMPNKIEHIDKKEDTNGYYITERHYYLKGYCKKCLDSQRVIINNN